MDSGDGGSDCGNCEVLISVPIPASTRDGVGIVTDKDGRGGGGGGNRGVEMGMGAVGGRWKKSSISAFGVVVSEKSIR